MNKEIKEISNKLINEINQFNQAVDNYKIVEKKVNEGRYSDNLNERIEKRLKKQEGYYERLHELYERNKQIVQHENRVKEMFNEYMKVMNPMIYQCKNKIDEIGNKLNQTLEEMKEKEKEIRGENYDREFDEEQYKKYEIETSTVKQRRKELQELRDKKKMEEEERVRRQKEKIKKSIEYVEKETKRYGDNTLFDSDVDEWSINNTTFSSKLQNQSNLIFVIETTEDQLFGYYISSQINVTGKYLNDPNAFIFKKSNYGWFEKYPIKEPKNAIKIGNEKDDELFVVGWVFSFGWSNGDIVIKKKEKINECSCSQSSFDYQNKQNVLIGRKGTFEVKRIVVVGPVTQEEHLKRIDVLTQEDTKYIDGIIPNNITKLDRSCFQGCEYTKITIPQLVKEVPKDCFYQCEKLKELTIPTSITKLRDRCFAFCKSLTSLKIPTNVIEIGDNCFHGMTSLKEIEIPSSVTEFGNNLFMSCSSLTSVTLYNNYNEVKEQDFNGCPSLSSIVLPTTVTKIGNYAFAFCSSLVSINLTNVIEFGYKCFGGSGIKEWNYPYLPDHCFERGK